MKVIGKMKGTFTNDSKETVEYARAYVTYEKEGVIGQVSEEKKIPVDLFEKLVIGNEVVIATDNKGRVIEFMDLTQMKQPIKQ